MPDYEPELRGISLSEALTEAAAVAPTSRVMLDTFEMWHPTLEDPVRVVNDYNDLHATLEPTAPRDAGIEVEFLACGVKITRAEESDTAAAPEITLSVDNVSGLMSQALKIARGSLDPWVIINRVYANDDTTGPAIMPPLTLHIVSIEISPTTLTITARFADIVNIAVPRTSFKLNEYPGLEAK